MSKKRMAAAAACAVGDDDDNDAAAAVPVPWKQRRVAKTATDDNVAVTVDVTAPTGKGVQTKGDEDHSSGSSQGGYGHWSSMSHL